MMRFKHMFFSNCHPYYISFLSYHQALARVQGELEILSRERSALMMEKQHFADEAGMQKALVSSALALKAQLKVQAEELIGREEEVLAMRRAAQRLQLQRDEEDAQIKKVCIIF